LPILIASGFAELEGLAGAQWPRLRKPYGLNDLATALRNLSAQAGEDNASNPAIIRA
jgi:hypothetical protein